MESSNGIYKNTVQITNDDVISIMYNTLRKKQFHNFAELFSFTKNLE